MDVESIAKTVSFGLALMGALLLYRFAIKHLIKGSTQKLWFSAGAFAFLSLIILFSDKISFINDSVKVRDIFTTSLQVVWWFSLNYLLNEIIEIWVWRRLLVKKGIVISKILRDLISILIIVITIAAIIYFVFDRSVLGIFTASGVMAIILGYSAQATLSDVFAGLGLNTSKEFIEGDWIKVNDQVGRVVDINWRFVKLITRDDNHLTIANSVIAKLPLTNLSSPTSVHAVTLNFPAPSNISPNQYKQMLVSAALQVQKVLKKPEPKTTLQIKPDSSHQYQLTYYTDEINDAPVTDELLSIIWYMSRRAHLKTPYGIEIITPENPPIQEVKDFLKKTDFFSILNKIEIKALSDNIIYHHYGAPERILEQGQENSSLYLIYQGGVNIFISNQSMHHQQVATLGSGQYFGEMSLLTGELCSASIYANQECIILEINHDNIAAIFAKRPVLMEKITENVIRRKHSNEDLAATLTKGKNQTPTSLVDRMVDRVKSFFKLSISKHATPPENKQ